MVSAWSWLRRLYRWLKHARLLAELEDRLRTQDNRATAWPLYVVEQEERIFGLDPQYADESTHYVWQYEDDWEYVHESDDELRAEHPDDDWGDELADPLVEKVEAQDGAAYCKIFYAKRWTFVCAHLTERAAEQYVAQNRHNLTNPRVYVTSQHRCYEWQDVLRVLCDKAGR